MERRAAIGLLLVLALSTSGCTQVVAGGPITFEASPATVQDGTLQEQGYQLGGSDTVQVNQTVDVPVVGERRVEITNHVRSYAKADVEGGTGEASGGGALVVLSTPQAQVAGQATNPLGRAPVEELVKRVGSRAGSQSDVEHVGTTSITVLGTDTDVEKFATTTERDGQTVETYVYVTRVAHGSDYVIAVGVLPQEFADAEEDAIHALIAGIEHAAGSE